MLLLVLLLLSIPIIIFVIWLLAKINNIESTEPEAKLLIEIDPDRVSHIPTLASNQVYVTKSTINSGSVPFITIGEIRYYLHGTKTKDTFATKNDITFSNEAGDGMLKIGSASVSSTIYSVKRVRDYIWRID